MVVIIELRNVRVIALDQSAARGVPLLCGQCQTGVLAKRVYRLDEAFTKTGFAHNQRPVMVL